MMNKSQVLFLMISISAITLIGREVIDRYAFPKIAQAQSTQTTQSGGQTKWEYCAIKASIEWRSNIVRAVPYTTIRYYQSSGWRTETVEFDDYRQNHDSDIPVASAIAKLGDEGWEMVDNSTSKGTSSWIYFKRPKR
jgi:hypothetical protein